MKTSFSSPSDVAHLWANQTQDNAKCSNVFFSGKNIYSYGYHFVIAKHAQNIQGEACVLFTERTYSNTTAKHISVVRQASQHLIVISVPNPEYSPEQNFNAWLSEVQSIATGLTTARKPEKYLSQIKQVEHKVIKYSKFFDYSVPEQLLAALSIGNKAEFLEFESKAAAFEAERQKKQADVKKKAAANELKNWKAGKINRLHIDHKYDLLRLDDKYPELPPIINTTQAVHISIPVALAFHKRIVSGKLKAGDAIDNWRVISVSKDEIKIGCHLFNTKHLVDFGNNLLTLNLNLV